MSNKDGADIFDINTGKKRDAVAVKDVKIDLENIQRITEALQHLPDITPGQYNYVPQRLLDAKVDLGNKSDQELIIMTNKTKGRECLSNIYFNKMLIEELKKRKLIT